MNVEQKAGKTQGSGHIDSISHPQATIPQNTVSNRNIRLHARIVSTFDVGIVISHGGSKVYITGHNTQDLSGSFQRSTCQGLDLPRQGSPDKQSESLVAKHAVANLGKRVYPMSF